MVRKQTAGTPGIMWACGGSCAHRAARARQSADALAAVQALKDVQTLDPRSADASQQISQSPQVSHFQGKNGAARRTNIV